MDLRMHGSEVIDIFKVRNEEYKKNNQNFVSLKKEENIEEQKNNLLGFDYSADEILANYSRASLRLNSRNHKKEIPNGHSRYEYKGGRFDIYRNDDEYKSQFVRPYDFDNEEFIEKFPELENQQIIKSDSSKSINDINGDIDETISQSSSTGDCWMIASVISMSKNEKGREIIKNSVTLNDDNTVTVSFRGIGVSYTLSQDEIEKYDTDLNTYDSYSNGDNDMLVLELAVEKLWDDINFGKVKLDTDNENITFTGDGYGIENGGLPSQMIYYLTGVESDEYYNETGDLNQNQIYQVLEDALKSKNTVLNIGIYDNIHSCILTDGSIFTLDVGSGGHALAVVDVTDDTVTFVNPWDSSIEYTASWSEFASLGIGYISSSNLDEATEKETVDMTDDTSYNRGYNPYSDYNYSYDYKRRGDRNYGFDFNYDSKVDFNDEIEFDPDNNEIRPDFNNDETTPDSSFDFNIQSYIMELLAEFMNLFKSLFSLLRI